MDHKTQNAGPGVRPKGDGERRCVRARHDAGRGAVHGLGDLGAAGCPLLFGSGLADFLLCLGELFTLVAYGQLIIEKTRMDGVNDDLLAQIFDFMVRDFSKYALQLYSKPSSTAAQMEGSLRMIRKPVVDEERFLRVWQQEVLGLVDAYEMNP